MGGRPHIQMKSAVIITVSCSLSNGIEIKVSEEVELSHWSGEVVKERIRAVIDAAVESIEKARQTDE